jgi:hypothetical protein
MRTTRLNERDLTRIVRRVLREEEAMGGGAPKMGGKSPKMDCFKDVTIPYPQSCKDYDDELWKQHWIKREIGLSFTTSKKCLSDIGAMVTMNNLTEVAKVLGCLAKVAGTGGIK